MAHATMSTSKLAQCMMCAGSHGSMHPHPNPHPHLRQASPVAHPSRPFRAVPEGERATSPDLSTMYNKGFPKSPRAAPRSPRAKPKASVAQVQVQHPNQIIANKDCRQAVTSAIVAMVRYMYAIGYLHRSALSIHSVQCKRLCWSVTSPRFVFNSDCAEDGWGPSLVLSLRSVLLQIQCGSTVRQQCVVPFAATFPEASLFIVLACAKLFGSPLQSKICTCSFQSFLRATCIMLITLGLFTLLTLS